MKHHETLYNQYRPVHQTKISANVHYTSQFAKLIVH